MKKMNSPNVIDYKEKYFYGQNSFPELYVWSFLQRRKDCILGSNE